MLFAWLNRLTARMDALVGAYAKASRIGL